MHATVYLIGAGPGAPDLITLRGYRCLQQADVVIFDHLVHPDLLTLAPKHAERIDVGSAAPEPRDQDAICYLLAEKAREGKTVARLKWGDPFLFDQGGEEALFLHEQGVRYEVVPGVPHAIGATAYAGIPITYPGGGDTVTFVRGHEDEGREKARIDWTALATLDGTIVSYAGPQQLPKMLDALIEHGRSPDEPAAIILQGTLSSQKTITGTLSSLLEQLKEQPVGAGLLIVGKVVNFRDHLRWFDSRPLFGRRALVMHSKEQPDDLADLLRAQGAEVDPRHRHARRRLPAAARSQDRSRHVHERIGGAQLRRQLRRRSGRPTSSRTPWSPSRALPPPTPPRAPTSRRRCRSRPDRSTAFAEAIVTKFKGN